MRALYVFDSIGCSQKAAMEKSIFVVCLANVVSSSKRLPSIWPESYLRSVNQLMIMFLLVFVSGCLPMEKILLFQDGSTKKKTRLNPMAKAMGLFESRDLGHYSHNYTKSSQKRGLASSFSKQQCECFYFVEWKTT